MILVPVDPRVVGDLLKLAKITACAIWVGSDGVTDHEFATLVQQGANITRFSYPLGTASDEELFEALDTVALHHPGEVIWAQHRPPERG